jgi:hypothetical protein
LILCGENGVAAMGAVAKRCGFVVLIAATSTSCRLWFEKGLPPPLPHEKTSAFFFGA